MSTLDPQLSPNYTTPTKCINGCARWDNLAADGNTRNQNDVNAKWSGGQPPANAGNMCAMPVNDDAGSQGPWCYCAGTNDSSWGYCQNRDSSASVCKSKPNGLNDLYANIQSCTSNVEVTNINTFGTTINNLNTDVQNLAMIVMDSFALGDSIEGKAGFSKLLDEVKQRNTELKNKKASLTDQVEKDDATITRFNRDFSYYKDTQPEQQSSKKINFVEDYTTAILSLAYLFMLIAAIYAYSFVPAFAGKKLLMGSIGGVIVSVVLYIIVYLFA
jgi:hypothetical protein